MIKIKEVFRLIIFFLFNITLYAQTEKKYERKLFFPDLDNYKTLLTDFPPAYRFLRWTGLAHHKGRGSSKRWTRCNFIN